MTLHPDNIPVNSLCFNFLLKIYASLRTENDVGEVLIDDALKPVACCDSVVRIYKCKYIEAGTRMTLSQKRTN